jgi:hypothetical protein
VAAPPTQEGSTLAATIGGKKLQSADAVYNIFLEIYFPLTLNNSATLHCTTVHTVFVAIVYYVLYYCTLLYAVCCMLYAVL